ncbi:hypothetical protein PMAYCL1PPCAC_03538, partial [Pristionchus mayeri]
IDLIGTPRLQTNVVKVIIAGLSLPTDKFASSFFSALEESKSKYVAGTLFNGIKDMICNDCLDDRFIQHAGLLLDRVFEDEFLRSS